MTVKLIELQPGYYWARARDFVMAPNEQSDVAVIAKWLEGNSDFADVLREDRAEETFWTFRVWPIRKITARWPVVGELSHSVEGLTQLDSVHTGKDPVLEFEAAKAEMAMLAAAEKMEAAAVEASRVAAVEASRVAKSSAATLDEINASLREGEGERGASMAGLVLIAAGVAGLLLIGLKK